MRHLALTILIVTLATPALAEEVTMAAAMTVARDDLHGWILAVNASADQTAFDIAVVAANGDVVAYKVSIDGEIVSKQVLDRPALRADADRVRDAAGKVVPDLVALVERMEHMTDGCDLVEAELEVEGSGLVMEVECRHGDVEVELAFTPGEGRLVEIEVEKVGEHDREGEDEGEDEELNNDD